MIEVERVCQSHLVQFQSTVQDVEEDIYLALAFTIWRATSGQRQEALDKLKSSIALAVSLGRFLSTKWIQSQDSNWLFASLEWNGSAKHSFVSHRPGGQSRKFSLHTNICRCSVPDANHHPDNFS